MNYHHSLVAYHERKRAEAELELARLRRSTMPTHYEPADSSSHIGPIVGALAVVGAVTVAAIAISILLADD